MKRGLAHTLLALGLALAALLFGCGFLVAVTLAKALA